MPIRKPVPPELSRQREIRAYALRIDGDSFETIGRKLGISHEGARQAVRRRMAAIQHEAAVDASSVRDDLTRRAYRLHRKAVRDYRNARRVEIDGVGYLIASLSALALIARMHGVLPSEEPSGGRDLDLLAGLHDSLSAEVFGNSAVADLVRRLDKARAGVRRRPRTASKRPGK
jgi:hypothetical protein